jgi:anti-sigma factor RsiW
VEYERRFRDAVRARVPRVSAPEDFKQQLTAAMSKVPRRRPALRRLAWGFVPATAALALVITFTWTVTSGFSPLIDEAVLQHSAAPPVEINTSDSGQVENWFRKKVDFNVTLPRFTKKVSLEGARLSHLARRQAALVRYRRGSHRFSLFVVTDPGGSLEGKKCLKVKTTDFCMTQLRGYTVVLWRSRGLAYSLVGDSAEQEIMEVLNSANSF